MPKETTSNPTPDLPRSYVGPLKNQSTKYPRCGRPIASAARLADSPEEMVHAVEKDINTIGIITGRLKAGDLSAVLASDNDLPVLAIAAAGLKGTLAEILVCLQKR